MISTANFLPTLELIAADKSTNRPYKTATKTKQGTAYFIRHGESTFNERNIFAGVVDAELTTFGKMQARQAGQDIKRKNVTFDAVYVLHLRRARQTCEIALVVSDRRSPHIQPQMDRR